MADIRISCEIYSHPKIKKLRRRLGGDAVHFLFQLWMWAAKNRPSGELSGMTFEDIELAIDWDGDESIFAKTLIELAFIDEVDGELVIHDWVQHNPWAANAQERKDSARKAAKARWDKTSKTYHNNAERNAEPMQAVCGSDAERNADLCEAHAVRIDSAMPLSLLISSNLDSSNLDLPSTPVVHEQNARSRKRVSPGRFDEFWARYPAKGSKAKAEVAWKKVTDEQAVLDALDAQIKWRIERQRANVWTAQWRHASTWLNQRGWEDVLDPLPTAPILSLPAKRAQTQAERNRSGLAEWLAMEDEEL